MKYKSRLIPYSSTDLITLVTINKFEKKGTKKDRYYLYRNFNNKIPKNILSQRGYDGLDKPLKYSIRETNNHHFVTSLFTENNYEFYDFEVRRIFKI
jgi:hypothetical protein